MLVRWMRYSRAAISQGVKEAVESKVFGLGVESYTVGSHELMMGYAITRNKLIARHAGTSIRPRISNKISSIMQYMPELLLHVSRPVRWDSDHVVTLRTTNCTAIMQQVVRNGYTQRVKHRLWTSSTRP